MGGTNGGFGNLASKLDDVAIWGEALSLNDISDLYAAGAGLKISTSTDWPTDGGSMGTNLRGLWNLDDASGTSVADSSANTNTETIIAGEQSMICIGKPNETTRLCYENRI